MTTSNGSNEPRLTTKTESFSSSPKDVKPAATTVNDLLDSTRAVPQNQTIEAKPAERVNPSVDTGPPKVVHASALPIKTQAAMAVQVATAATSSATSAGTGTGTGVPIPIQPALSTERVHAAAPTERSTKPKGGALRRGKWTVRTSALLNA